MTYKIETTETAERETEEAAFYYENVSTGLGLAFLDELEKKYQTLCKNPEAYSYIDGKKILRDVQIKRFPFVVIYKLEAEKVIVISVHQTQKRPKF